MKIGRSSISFQNVYYLNSGVVVGPKEKAGPLGNFFDYSFTDLHCGEKSWEKAEIKMVQTSMQIAMQKSELTQKDIDLVISGDLNNQLVVGSYTMRNYDIPYLGVFSACATSVEALILASIIVDKEGMNNVLVNVSSHNALAEKQFRFPNEYGGQKPRSITSTVTSATSIILCNGKNVEGKNKIKLKKCTFGKVVDYDIKDAQALGRCMAPACYNTLKEHLEDFNIDVNYYDIILSGDLSKYGKELFVNVCYSQGININNNYEDCGVMIYDITKQKVHSGGSGCGCLPAVAFSYIIAQMLCNNFKKVLLLATGALHNPAILNQKESVPGICHAISLEVEE